MSNRRYFIWNWKDFLTPPVGDILLGVLSQGADQFPDDTHILAPDALHLGRFFDRTPSSSLALAAQDIAPQEYFPFTGALSLRQVASIIDYVLVGHSERRKYAAEFEGILAEKLKSLSKTDKKLIYCIGETTKTFDYSQIKIELTHQLETLKFYDGGEVLLCYEPSWAIGTGVTPAQDILADIFSFISATCHDFGIGDKAHLIYGGSVNHENIDEILSVALCEGVIIGTASTQQESIVKIFQTI